MTLFFPQVQLEAAYVLASSLKMQLYAFLTSISLFCTMSHFATNTQNEVQQRFIFFAEIDTHLCKLPHLRDT